MELTKQLSKLHRKLQLEEYSIPFKNLNEFINGEEFINYIEYFQIDTDFVCVYNRAKKLLDYIKDKEEFVKFIKYFEISKEYLLQQICDCKYLEYLYEYMKNDIIELLKDEFRVISRNNEYYETYYLNDKNLKYINRYIEIIELDASFNPNITTVKPFAKTLKILKANHNECGINDKGLKYACNLEELHAVRNEKITTVKPFAKTLKILYAYNFINSGITDYGLRGATNLQVLKSYNSYNITYTFKDIYITKDLNDIKNKEEFFKYIKSFEINKKFLLEEICNCRCLNFLHEYMKDNIIELLKFDLYYKLNDTNLKYISQYIEITELSARDNPNITTVEPFGKTLKRLHAGGDNCGINDDGLKYACNLVDLCACNNPKITTIQPFVNTLKILFASGNCGINNNGLCRILNLEVLYSYKNPKITIKIE